VNLLPWLLDWPPGPARVAVVLLLTTASVATLVAFGGVVDDGGNVTVASTDLDVRLNDDGSIPDTNGTVETCIASGTPPDSVLVVGEVVVDVPPDAGDERLHVRVGLPALDAATTRAVEGTGRERVDVFWLLDDDETLAVGDRARLRIEVRGGGSTATAATRRVAVANGSRSYDC
jgi:hypothetical protein